MPRTPVASPTPEPYHRIDETAKHFAISRQTLVRCYDLEGLPANVLTESPRTITVNGLKRSGYLRRGRRTLLFKWSEVEAWLAGRRERHVRAVLDGQKYTRRSAA